MIAENDIEQLKEYVYLASSPAFVWLKFKKSEPVKLLRDNKTTSDLLAEFENLEIDTDNIDKIIKGFALLIALLTKPGVHIGVLKNSSNVGKLPWGNKLLSFAESQGKIIIPSSLKTRTDYFRFEPPVITATGSEIKTNYDTNFLEVTQEPQVIKKPPTSRDVSNNEEEFKYA